MSQYTELEERKAVLATQELLAFESVDISEFFGDEFDKSERFQKPTTVNIIEQRERERIPKKTRQSTAWSVNVYRAWAEYRNTQIETLGDEYKSVPVDLGTTPVEEVNYRHTRFILEVMRGDGKLYPYTYPYPCSISSLLMSSYFTPQFPCASKPPPLYII